MITLRIEHKIVNYDGWKKSFDSDPINRKQSGVKHYRIFRPTDEIRHDQKVAWKAHLQDNANLKLAARHVAGALRRALLLDLALKCL